MRSSLVNFHNKLEQLSSYIEYLDEISPVIKHRFLANDNHDIKPKIENLKAKLSALSFRKIFEYNSIITSLYGYFERFIEEQIIEYLDEICTFLPNYDKLPSKIQENHSYLTANLIRNLNLPKYSLENPKSIASNLNSCLNDNRSALNKVAYTDHTSNFRIQSLSEIFGGIGISGLSHRIKNDEFFKRYLQIRFGEQTDLSRTKDEIVFSFLNDLAQRRNDISHGNSNNSILSNSILLEYFDFFKNYTSSLNNVLYEISLEFKCKEKYKITELINIFDSKILCLNLENVNVKIGDKIIVQVEGNNSFYTERTIEEIQIDNIALEEIQITDTTAVGFKLNRTVKENQIFYIMK